VEVVLLHALYVDRKRFQAVDEGDAQMQAGARHRIELAEAGDDGALVLADGEEWRDDVEDDGEAGEGGKSGKTEQALGGSAAAGAWDSGYGNLCHRRLLLTLAGATREGCGLPGHWAASSPMAVNILVAGKAPA